MNTRTFSKEFPVGYQWIYIILLIVFLCFASIYNSYSAVQSSEALENIKMIRIDTDVIDTSCPNYLSRN